jgi:type II secretory ATPase GspE/PulE/Tfp pilus assembly ATPase PilB-like protein
VSAGAQKNRSMTTSPGEARGLVERTLEEALGRRASDVHVEPVASGYEVRFRVDGLLETVARHDAGTGRSMVNRLMVLAQLLTYRQDVPQEGRLRLPLASGAGASAVEMRVAIMPTHHGLRAAVRLPAELIQPRTLEDLGLPAGVYEGLLRFARCDSGMLVVTGPAGSGKTTTIYALLQKIVELSPGLSVIALEDPVERAVPGITQIEVTAFGELTYERALRSILRQDPQVLMLGEIRDAATASLAVQAALSGHRLVCTLHAASPAGAIARLLEMGVEPYQLTSALFGVVAQRLVRRRSEGGGYSGRAPLAEIAVCTPALRAAVLDRADADRLRAAYESEPGYRALREAAAELVGRGVTDAQEVERVLG